MTPEPSTQEPAGQAAEPGLDHSTRTFLRLAIAGIFVGSLLFIVVILAFAPDQMRRIVNPVAAMVVTLVAWLLLRSGRSRAGTLVLAYGTWATVAGIAITSGGLSAPAVFSLPVIIFFCGWVLGSRAAIILTTLSITGFLVIAVTEYLGMLPPARPTPSFMHWVVQVMINVIAAAAIIYLRNSHARQVEEVRTLSAELARERAEAATAETLRRNQDLLDRTGRLARVGGWELDVASNTLTWTAETFRIHELESTSAPPRDQEVAFYAPEARASIETALENAIVSGSSFDLELPLDTAKGRRVWVRTLGEPQLEDGKVARVTGALQDISARREADQALRNSLNNLQLTLEATDEGIFGYDGSDPSGKFLFANDRLFEIWKIPPEEAPNTGRAEITAAARTLFIDPDAGVQRVKEILALGVVQELKVPLNDGRILFARSIPLKEGSQVSRVWSFRDITAEERARAELKASRDEARQANAAKSEFLSRMSHELRTPMHAIMGMVSLARRRMADPDGLQQLDKAKAAADHLLSLINDILDISKIEAGRLTLEQADFRLIEVLQNLVNLVAQKAADKGLQLLIDRNVGITERPLRGDSLRLGQILLNLVGNAIKFTDHGTIAVRILLVEDSPSDLLLRFEVQDHGIGIGAEEQQRLFVAFEQADGSMTRKFGGTGLGLAISKRLAGMMGGEIGVDSLAGQGSTFWFTARMGKTGNAAVPAPATSAPDAAEALLRQHFAGALILLAEDNPVNQEVARGQLEHAGLTVDLAEDGAIALTLARATRYDLILMDMQMPNMNGVDASRAIRADSLNTATPILAMTANAFDEDRELCIAAGMNDHIGKPVEITLLFDTLLKWLRRSRAMDSTGEGTHEVRSAESYGRESS